MSAGTTKAMPISTTLGELFPNSSLTEKDQQRIVRGLSLDSRTVKKGDVFFAYPGVEVDGRQYIQAAVEQGAVTIIVESGESQGFDWADLSVPVLMVDDLRHAVGDIAASFWGVPSAQLSVVAVTGTNGKTSVTQMIAESMASLGNKGAVIGTLGNGVLGQLKETKNTTPDALQIQALLAEFVRENIDVVAMEASSHGLEQGRLLGTNIDIAVVTNIARDHLDYHGSMEAYQRAKAGLVMWPGIQQVILNADDAGVMALTRYIAADVEVVTFSYASTGADVRAEDIVYSKRGLEFTLVTSQGRENVKNQLVGEFNISNLLAVAAVLHCQQYDIKKIALALNSISQVPGRMQEVGLSNEQQNVELPGVIVDFAHTPDALEKALAALKPHCEGKLWCVFGCGGERDKGKRPEMGAMAAKYADRMVITTDNPRNESASDIVKEIEDGIGIGAAYQVELNREDAVRCAVMNAANDDLILLAGKGHEDYQEINGKKHPYSDKDVAEKILYERLQCSIAGGGQC